MIDPKDFHYDLPGDRIAQTPANPRDAAKLMLINRDTENITHDIFKSLPDFLTNNDVLVLNDSKVFPARLMGKKESGGVAEVLLLKPIGNDSWEALSRGLKPSQIVRFDSSLTGMVTSKNIDSGTVTIQLSTTDISQSLTDAIELVGKTPIPPYIHSPLSETNLRREYQTVYANQKGSAAAPTAGLHFTNALLQTLEHRGVQIERLTLHVGLGTFAKLRPEQIETKTLHHEWYSISPETAHRLNQAKKQGKRIVAVGTTACRALESAASSRLQGLSLQADKESPYRTTNIFIYPPYQFKFIDALITNFHLPESSLLMLVTAFCAAPNTSHTFHTFHTSLMGQAYQQAIDHQYRFFSFGDAMLIT